MLRTLWSLSSWTPLVLIPVHTFVKENWFDKLTNSTVMQSPRGLVRCLLACNFCIRSMPQQQQPDVMLQGDAVAAIAAITSKRRLERLAAWPEVAGGGAARAADLVTKCYQILHLPLESTGPKSLEYQQALLQHRIVPSAVQLLPSLSSKAIEACVVLVARLTFIPGAAFVHQFVSSNGLQNICVASILGGVSHSTAVQPAAALPGDAVIVEALHLLSNVARASAAHYPALQVCCRDDGSSGHGFVTMLISMFAGLQFGAPAVLAVAA
jgi:hypothetical protein